MDKEQSSPKSQSQQKSKEFRIKSSQNNQANKFNDLSKQKSVR
jgi:hypothetical protein